MASAVTVCERGICDLGKDDIMPKILDGTLAVIFGKLRILILIGQHNADDLSVLQVSNDSVNALMASILGGSSV